MRNQKVLIRGMLALAILGLVTAALVVSPVGAATTVTKKKAKNIAKKQVNNLAPGIATGIATGIAQTTVNTDNSSAEGIFASFKDGPAGVPNTLTTIASLPVPAGHFAFFAKVEVFEGAFTGESIAVTCRLEAGGDFDQGREEFESAAFSGFAAGVISLEVVHTFAAAGTVELKCADEPPAATNDEWRFAKIIGIRGPSLVSAPSPVRIETGSSSLREG